MRLGLGLFVIVGACFVGVLWVRLGLGLGGEAYSPLLMPSGLSKCMHGSRGIKNPLGIC